MTKKFTEAEALAIMEEAFSAEANDPIQQSLELLLSDQPEFQNLWKEFLTLRRGIEGLEANSVPSEMTRARILQAANQQTQPRSVSKPSKIWRVLLSQPVVAAATVALFVGFGIYSHFWRQEPTRNLPPVSSPVQPQEEKRGAPEPSQVLIEKDAATSEAPKGAASMAPADDAKERKAPVVQKPKLDAPKKMAPPPPSPALRERAPTTVPVGNSGSSPQPAAKALGGRALERAGVAPEAVEGQIRDQAEDSLSSDKLMQGSDEQAPEQEATSKSEEKQKQAEPVATLVKQAKVLMEEGNYREALIKLKEAQQSHDSQEIRKLISQCRAALMKNKQ